MKRRQRDLMRLDSNYRPISLSREKLRIEVKHYSRRFSKLIPNIYINIAYDRTGFTQEEKIMIYRFIKSNCSAELKSITLSSGAILDPTASETIEDQLNSIKMLKIY